LTETLTETLTVTLTVTVAFSPTSTVVGFVTVSLNETVIENDACALSANVTFGDGGAFLLLNCDHGLMLC